MNMYTYIQVLYGLSGVSRDDTSRDSLLYVDLSTSTTTGTLSTCTSPTTPLQEPTRYSLAFPFGLGSILPCRSRSKYGQLKNTTTCSTDHRS